MTNRQFETFEIRAYGHFNLTTLWNISGCALKHNHGSLLQVKQPVVGNPHRSRNRQYFHSHLIAQTQCILYMIYFCVNIVRQPREVLQEHP